MPLPLSLRPTPRPGDRAEPLSSVIEQIFAERGHLRDITEESLQAEIKAETEDDSSSSASVSGGDDDNEHPAQDIESRIKEIHAARLEMLNLVGQANNDAMTALDFISLLLSKDAPRQADPSMSPALKSMVPAGTLGFDKTDASKPTKADQDWDQKVALGLNFESLNSAADRLLGSATRLEMEIQRETKYWDQILSVSEKGWDLCRMPGQKHNVGVRFGFSEASPQFQARSLAALKPDESGDLFLDRESSGEAKTIRVRIREGDVIMETSTTPLLAVADRSPLDVLVHQARDSLFDEELYFELTRDARNLFSNGVRATKGEILVPFDTRPGPAHPGSAAAARRSLVIDLVSRSRVASTGGSTADCIVLALRLLLTYEHRQKHRLRSEPPPPLTLESRPSQTLNLLQPFLNYVEFSVRKNELQSALSRLHQTLQAAGVECAVKVHESLGPKLRDLDWATSGVTIMEQVVALISGALSTTFECELPSAVRLSAQLTTDISPPTFGTTYALEIIFPLLDSPATWQRVEFSEFTQLLRHMEKVVRESTVLWIAENISEWAVDSNCSEPGSLKSSGGKQLTVKVSDGQLAVAVRDTSTNPNARGVVAGAWDYNARPHRDSLLAVCVASVG